MSKHNWLTFKDFSEKHEVIIVNLHVLKSKNKNHPAIKGTMIDEKYFIRRLEFRRKVWLQAHENYYVLSKHLKDAQIAEMLSIIHPEKTEQSWSVFISSRLFELDDKSIVNCGVSDMLWVFWRTTSMLLNRLFRKAGVPAGKRDLNILLERK